MGLQRKHPRFTLTAGFWLGLLLHTLGQEIAIGQWRDHLPYQNVKRLAVAPDRVYCATNFGLFEYRPADQSVLRISKVNGLSDFSVSTIAWSDAHQLLIVAYDNANIDIIENNQIFNVSDIKRKSILGNKSINSILFRGDYAYLSCGFGIVVLDVTRKEVKDTYIIGPGGTSIGVNDLACDGIDFYAATEKGIFQANASNPNLVNFTAWTQHTGFTEPNANYNLIASFQGKIIANKSFNNANTDTLFVFDGNLWTYFNSAVSWKNYDIEAYNDGLYVTNYFSVEIYDTALVRKDLLYGWAPDIAARHAMPGPPGVKWIADNNHGLIRYINNSLSESIAPNGPRTNNAVGMAISENLLWVASGGTTESGNNLWRTEGIFHFDNQSWKNIHKGNSAGLDTLFDPIAIVTDPSNARHVFVGTWSRGLAEFTNSQLTKVYNEKNSALRAVDVPGFYWIGVGGLAFDDSGNLWMSNASVANPLVVKKADGQWKSYSLSPYVTTGHNVGPLITTTTGQQWIIVTRGSTKGIVIFDGQGTFDNTSDDQRRMLRSGIGNGNLPSDEVLSIAEDRDGEIWVGTREGPAVFYTPELALSGGSAGDAQRILVERDGYTEYLLDGTAITAIAVDGANRKWLGTDISGVFLLSADGTEEIMHFTTENSPLFSNKITAISINHENGEVFFATDQGLISYKATATQGEEKFEDVLVYPNPVREDYDGPIAIRGLAQDANVKITTISGSVVYETTALGGQAIWNGRNFDGVDAHSGVYLVFCSNEDGSETLVTKIVVIRGQ